MHFGTAQFAERQNHMQDRGRRRAAVSLLTEAEAAMKQWVKRRRQEGGWYDSVDLDEGYIEGYMAGIRAERRRQKRGGS